MKLCESFHRFDLPEGSRHHEDVNPNDSTGVDIEVAGDPAVWLEVKNYEAPTIPAQHREAQREKFANDVADDLFWPRIAAKFAGTDSVLKARGERPPAPVLALAFRCQRLRLGDLAAFTSILERHIANMPALSDARAAVLPLEALDDYLSNTQVASCSIDASGICRSHVSRCSVDRRNHRS